MDATHAAYDEVYVYAMGRPGFLLQHVVDAFGVQTARNDSKPIRAVFGLIGLYLRVEEKFSGRQVQEVHMKLVRRRREWPDVQIPEARGSMTIADVLAAPAGAQRDIAIDDWCGSIWTAVSDNRETVIAVLAECKIS